MVNTDYIRKKATCRYGTGRHRFSDGPHCHRPHLRPKIRRTPMADFTEIEPGLNIKAKFRHPWQVWRMEDEGVESVRTSGVI